eukprot:7001950-Prymnesium_polylepis.1
MAALDGPLIPRPQDGCGGYAALTQLNTDTRRHSQPGTPPPPPPQNKNALYLSHAPQPGACLRYARCACRRAP